MKIWYNEMKKNPVYSSLKGFEKFKKNFLYLENMESILKENFGKNFFKIFKYPFCFKKMKLIIALLMPKIILKKIKNYWYYFVWVRVFSSKVYARLNPPIANPELVKGHRMDKYTLLHLSLQSIRKSPLIYLEQKDHYLWTD